MVPAAALRLSAPFAAAEAAALSAGIGDEAAAADCGERAASKPGVGDAAEAGAGLGDPIAAADEGEVAEGVAAGAGSTVCFAYSSARLGPAPAGLAPPFAPRRLIVDALAPRTDNVLDEATESGLRRYPTVNEFAAAPEADARPSAALTDLAGGTRRQIGRAHV